MAKGKKGKKGGKEAVVTEDINEVEKELFQVHIADLNRKVERLKARCLELEVENEQFRKNYTQLDEDRADIIAYLTKTAQTKTEEIEELEERIDGLIKSRNQEVKMFTDKITSVEHDYKIMHEQLSAEIKLLNGKLNSLEEFRIQREDLMKKFQLQETSIQEQEDRHKRILYEVERKFIIGKDKLVKEMESRLAKLSTDFRDATEMRIAATTHHAIRENIAISNELDLMLEHHNQLREENKRIKEQDKQLRLQVQIQQDEKDIIMNKNRKQIRLLNKLAEEHYEMSSQLAVLEFSTRSVKLLEEQVVQLQEELARVNHESRIKEQRLQAALYEQDELQIKTAETCLKYKRLSSVIDASVQAIQEVLQAKEGPDVDEATIKSRRETLLSRLLELMNTTTIQYMPIDSVSAESFIPYQADRQSIISRLSSRDKSIKTASSRTRSEMSKEVSFQSKVSFQSAQSAQTAHSTESQPIEGSPAEEEEEQ